MTATKTLEERISAIMADLKAIGKNSYNGAQRFNYRSIDDILNELHPLLAKHEVFIYPSKVRERVMEKRPTAKGGVQFSEQHVQEYTVRGGGESFTMEVPAESTDFGDKATTKAMTFAYKTALAQLFMIATDDVDPDGDSPEETVRNWQNFYQNAKKNGELEKFLAWAEKQPDAPAEMLTAIKRELAPIVEGDIVA